MRPLIGLNTTLTDSDDPLKAKSVCHLKYIDAVAGVGGVPVLIPPYEDLTQLQEALAPLQGFLLIGGPDYLPESYGGHPQDPNELMAPRRHVFDLKLADAVLKNSRMPVLGICGGHQLISLAYGGALVQDVLKEWQPPPQHATTLLHANSYRQGTAQEGDVYRHDVKLAPGSRVARIIGAAKVRTNSYHHQAVLPQQIGDGFVATAWAPDGVIEAIEPAASERFVLGIQWHPERQTAEAPQRAIFEALVAACKK